MKTDFYTVLVDKALIDIQNENLRLLQSQLTDQQNRFAAGTVPRFDVLQASVAVSNQRPQVITANNNFSLAFIGLARTPGDRVRPAAGTHLAAPSRRQPGLPSAEFLGGRRGGRR